jgi:hypothetical protein
MKKQKYGEYREAWHLLVEAARRKDDGPIDIQACSGEHSEESGAKARPAIREMFRRDIWGSEGAEVTMRGRKCSSP